MLAEWSAESFQQQREALDGARHAEAVAAFVQALYAADEAPSRRLLALASSKSGDPQHLARTLLAPAAGRIGEDWESDTSDFLAVTIAMSRLHLLFRQVTAVALPAVPQDPARRILLAPAPGNQHGFGLAVAEDAFRRDGWIVDGGACDADALLALAATHAYRIIGLSVGDDRAIPGLGAFASTLRSRSLNPAVVLMAGGSLAAREPGRLLAAGFDRVFADAAAAVRDAAAIACAAAPS